MELVIVIVLIGVIGAIAIPRMGSAADRSTTTAVAADLSNVQRAIDLYATEHLERGPATDPDGSTNPDPAVFTKRLLSATDDLGNVSPTGLYGPYLRTWPQNLLNKLSSVRIGGAAAGANTDGWRFDPATGAFESDAGSGKVGIGGATGLGGGIGVLADPGITP
jgi:type II secretory pathway pseudopilin PulG